MDWSKTQIGKGCVSLSMIYLLSIYKILFYFKNNRLLDIWPVKVTVSMVIQNERTIHTDNHRGEKTISSNLKDIEFIYIWSNVLNGLKQFTQAKQLSFLCFCVFVCRGLWYRCLHLQMNLCMCMPQEMRSGIVGEILEL